MFQNIIYENYTSSCLSITGPLLFCHYIHENILLYNKIENEDWTKSYLQNIENKIYIKNSYNDYYNENNYINTQHYNILYENREVFKKINIPYSKINKISHIVWINLNRSLDRRNEMMSLFYHIDIPNTRIEAVDGQNPESVHLNIPIHRNSNNNTMSNYEIACTYSHLKSIQSLLYKEGDYFMVCEDDISFEHIYLFEKDLKMIIEEAPPFDILLLHHFIDQNIIDLYTSWNDFRNITGCCIASTSCYIITKEAVRKFCNLYTCQNDTFTFHKPEIGISVADEFIYQNANTWVYKYNFIKTNENDSTIHNDHVSFHHELNQKNLVEFLIDCISK
jgi:GR25 family glycosyltransferase involved in LPS biosynthesis